MQIEIYSQSGQLKVTASPGSGGQCVKELQGDSVLNLSFDYFEYVALDVNDYVDFCGERYWLTEQYRPKEVSSVSWKYEVAFYGIESLIKRYLVVEHTDGDANPVFSLTAPAIQHVRMIVECLNNATGTRDWTVGTVVGTGNITIDYTGKYCDEGLRELAEAAGTEYWFDGTTVNLSRCELGELLEMSYGNGLISLERDVAENAKFYTRLYPIGSSRNIDPAQYGHQRLQLPGGAKYVDLEVGKYGVVDHYEQEAFSGIYPRYTGTVSGVRFEDRTDEDGTPFRVWFFRDSSLPFDPNDYLLPGEKMRVSFQSGDLQGLGETDDHYFEADYNSGTGEFEIMNIWTDGEQLPGGSLIPAVGDTYIPWNIGMPDEYYALAEQEFRAAVDNYNANHFVDISLYRGTTDHTWIEADSLTGREEVEMFIGRRIRLASEQYFPEERFRDSRITKITRRLDLPSLMEIEISDAIGKGTMTKISDSIKSVREYARDAGGNMPGIIRSTDTTRASDDNVYSALKALGMFLRKDVQDRASGHVTFGAGLTSERVASLLEGLLLGDGTYGLGADGLARLRSALFSEKVTTEALEVNGWARFEKLVYNMIQIMEQDYLFSGGADIEEAVDNRDGTFTLVMHKEKEGRHVPFGDYDILYGKVDELQTGGMYYTSWMRVCENGVTLNDGLVPDTVRVELWDDGMVPGARNFAPKSMMTVARRGNTQDTERQQFWELSGTEKRLTFYWHVDQPKLRADNYALCYGILPSILDDAGILPDTRDPGMPSLYVNTIFYEHAHRIYYPGRIVKEDRGEWVSSPTVTYTGTGGTYQGEEYVQGQAIAEPYHHEGFSRNMFLTCRLSPANAGMTDEQLLQKMRKEWHIDRETSRVWRYGALWECLVEGTAQAPELGCSDWGLIQQPAMELKITSTKRLLHNRDFKPEGTVGTTLGFVLMFGGCDMTSSVTKGEAVWTRQSPGSATDQTLADDDAAWNQRHRYGDLTVPVTSNDLPPNWATAREVQFTLTITKNGQPIGSNSITVH